MQRHRRRFAGKSPQPVAFGVAGNIDQHINLVVADQAGQLVIRDVFCVAPVLKIRAIAVGHHVFQFVLLGVGKQLHALGVVVGQQGLLNHHAGMGAKHRRHVAHAQAPRRRTRIGMRPPLLMQRHGKALIELLVRSKPLVRVHIGDAIDDKQKAAVRTGLLRTDLNGAAQCCQRLLHTPLVFEQHTQPDMGIYIVRPERKNFADALLGLNKTVELYE